jgi:hypothetical protein
MRQKAMQNIIVSLSAETVQKAKMLAAKRSTSLNDLLAMQIETLAKEDDGYEGAHRAALNLMERGFHLGGEHFISRDELHIR